MAKNDFTPFSRSFNPFRGIERSIDSMFDDHFCTGAAGALAERQPVGEASPSEPADRSLFMRVVQFSSVPRRN
ncbi:MAG: hypothetical protein VW600_02315 [Ferrovibrio sp.]